MFLYRHVDEWPGAFFVSAGRVVHANEAARAILNTTPGMMFLSAACRRSAMRFGIEGCTLETRAQVLSRNYVETLGDAEEEVNCILFATAYSDQDRSLSEEAHGTLLFLANPDNRFAKAVEAAAKIYGLTPAETACLALLVEGLSRDQIAEIRNVSPETIKDHTSRIRRKMSFRKLTEVIARVSLLDPPFTTD